MDLDTIMVVLIGGIILGVMLSQYVYQKEEQYLFNELKKNGIFVTYKDRKIIRINGVDVK